MGMFFNYQHIDENYMPNNLSRAFPSCVNDSKLFPVEASKPFMEYDVKGDLIGYFWHHGDTLNLEFNIDGEVTLEADAIVYDTAGVTPQTTTVGYVGKRAYNVIDLKSWTCTVISSGSYTWTEDSEFTYPEDGGKSVYISAVDYLRDKQIEVTIYNFRMEPIVNKIFSGSQTVIFNIDSKLSKALTKGIYYCDVRVFNDATSQLVFDSNDCKLLVR